MGSHLDPSSLKRDSKGVYRVADGKRDGYIKAWE